MFHTSDFSRAAGLAIGLVVWCGWTDAAEFSYKATTSSLEYSYTTVDDTPDGRISGFSITTPTGTLTGTVVLELGGGTVEFVHVESGQTARNSYLKEPGKNGKWAGHLEVPGLVDTFYEVDLATNEFRIVATAPGYFCSVMEGTEYYAMMNDATLKLNEEIEALGETGTPLHLAAIGSVVTLTKFAPNHIFCPGTTDPQAGGCYYDTDTYTDCTICCEPPRTLSTAFSVGCAAGAGALCSMTGAGAFWAGACTGAGAAGCGGLVAIAEQDCVRSNCIGKQGNPECPPSRVCGVDNDGHCMAFCGPGHTAACGSCAHAPSAQQECCN